MGAGALTGLQQRGASNTGAKRIGSIAAIRSRYAQINASPMNSGARPGLANSATRSAAIGAR